MNAVAFRSFAAVAVAGLAGSAVAQLGPELTTNGGFEAGDLSGWDDQFVAPGTFGLTNDAASGTFAAELANFAPVSGAVIKQANIGIGMVNPGDVLQISFSAKGSFAVGGVLFAEFFSEIDGGGVSQSEILGGGPLFVADQADYVDFTFQAVAGPDVSGGVTLQFAAVTGGDAASSAVAFIDNASVRVIPTPGAAAVLGLGGLAAMRRRR